MSVLVVVDDLFFRSRIEAAAHQAGVPLAFVTDPEPILSQPRTEPWRLAIVDLSLSTINPLDAVAMIRARIPAVPILAFISHVQTALRDEALRAGCAAVLSRSAFVRQLPQILQHGLASVGGCHDP